MNCSTRSFALVALAGLGIAATACSNDLQTEPASLVLVTYDSFPTEGTSLNDALASFTADTGIEVALVSAGDKRYWYMFR